MERAALPAALDRLFLCYKGKGPGQVCACVCACAYVCVGGGGGVNKGNSSEVFLNYIVLSCTHTLSPPSLRSRASRGRCPFASVGCSKLPSTPLWRVRRLVGARRPCFMRFSLRLSTSLTPQQQQEGERAHEEFVSIALLDFGESRLYATARCVLTIPKKRREAPAAVAPAIPPCEEDESRKGRCRCLQRRQRSTILSLRALQRAMARRCQRTTATRRIEHHDGEGASKIPSANSMGVRPAL
jgi:hypothetical protein